MSADRTAEGRRAVPALRDRTAGRPGGSAAGKGTDGGAGRLRSGCPRWGGVGGPGLGPGSGEETLQKLSLLRKKALSAQETDPDELCRRRAAPSTLPILVALLTLHVAPLAVLQMLRPCAEQRLPSEVGPVPPAPVARVRNKGSSALGGGQALAELGGQEASGQRMSHQPSAARLLRGCVCGGGTREEPPSEWPLRGAETPSATLLWAPQSLAEALCAFLLTNKNGKQ
uniref:Uncharacterized protein n=1 Tax=Equus asinus TaxID=9793 RepID=A0A9L0JDI0_EQUAS